MDYVIKGNATIPGSEDAIWQHNRIASARKHLKSLIDTSAKIRQAALDFNVDYT